jgi:hypothetical protein
VSMLLHYYAYATVLCTTQAAVVFAFSGAAYTTDATTIISSRKFIGHVTKLSAAQEATIPTAAERITVDLGGNIIRKLAPSERRLLLLDKVDSLVSCSDLNGQRMNQSICTKIGIAVENDVLWAKESPLPFENERKSHAAIGGNEPIIEYEPISVTTSTTDKSSTKTIALRTKSSTPLLTQNEIQLLREAVETYWKHLTSSEKNDASSKSRFTYQRKGNSEAHLSDIVRYCEQRFDGEKKQEQVSALVTKLLLDRVYPWIRDAFLSKEDDSNGDNDDLSLYLYDAIFIRYNATEAENVGAGQPLHRDLGYVSVNIMLNSQDEFDGGGTFFEDQLLPVVLNGDSCTPTYIHPLKPCSPGHGIAHYSSNRHAGSATVDGVRDILVFFVAAAAAAGRAPKWEVAARLKSTARSYCNDSSSIDEQLLCRVRHHRLAIEHVPSDGEAWHYLGMALLDYHNYEVAMQQQQQQNENCDCSFLRLAISCLEEATTHTPCDGRLQNNLGIALERLLEYHQSSDSDDGMTLVDRSRLLDSLRGQIATAYDRSIQIHTLCNQVGCDVKADYESACLNYGLFLSKIDDFEGAINILSLVAANYEVDEDTTDSGTTDASLIARRRVLRDANNLLVFCRRQIQK